jgi:hypothetical protein
VARIALLTHDTTPPQTMYTPTQNMDHRTYRHPPTFGMLLLLAALPLAVLFAATFPAATTGLFVGVATGTALQR